MAIEINSSSYLSKTRNGRIIWTAKGLLLSNRLQTVVGVGFKRTSGAPVTFGDLVESNWGDILSWDALTAHPTSDVLFTANVRGTINPSNITDALPGDTAYVFALQSGGSPSGATELLGVRSVGVLRA